MTRKVLIRFLFLALGLPIGVTVSKGPAAAAQAPSTVTSGSPESQPRVLAWERIKRLLAEENPAKRKLAVAALGAIGGGNSESMRLLGESLRNDKDVEVRSLTASALAETKSKKAIPLLKPALEDDPAVAFAAAKALWDLGNRSGMPVFEEILRKEIKGQPGMMTGAVRDARKKMRDPKALTMIGIKQVTGAFLGPAVLGIEFAQESLKDSGAPGRAFSASIMGDDRSPETFKLLEQALQDENPLVRAAACKSLGKRGNQTTIAKLTPFLYDKSDGVQAMASAAVIRLTRKK